jgi:hypothetical protein
MKASAGAGKKTLSWQKKLIPEPPKRPARYCCPKCGKSKKIPAYLDGAIITGNLCRDCLLAALHLLLDIYSERKE